MAAFRTRPRQVRGHRQAAVVSAPRPRLRRSSTVHPDVNVSFETMKSAARVSPMGRYRQLTPTKSSQRRGGEGCARGLCPLYLVQPTSTLPATSRSYDRLVPVSVSSRPVAQRPQPPRCCHSPRQVERRLLTEMRVRPSISQLRRPGIAVVDSFALRANDARLTNWPAYRSVAARCSSVGQVANAVTPYARCDGPL